ncbi:hypothetical protein PR048_026230 [Dryococelus australis]|uniref:Uncharacterized protein n=1 Tax=Dryococelus australis TaxID=614101 RepID=A0ABQ9GKU2_9NEOP|nr:hypothetical protein PR048_026230 [Dryococelus australis]
MSLRSIVHEAAMRDDLEFALRVRLRTRLLGTGENFRAVPYISRLRFASALIPVAIFSFGESFLWPGRVGMRTHATFTLTLGFNEQSKVFPSLRPLFAHPFGSAPDVFHARYISSNNCNYGREGSYGEQIKLCFFYFSFVEIKKIERETLSSVLHLAEVGSCRFLGLPHRRGAEIEAGWLEEGEGLWRTYPPIIYHEGKSDRGRTGPKLKSPGNSARCLRLSRRRERDFTLGANSSVSRLDHPPPTQAKWVRFPGGVVPGFSHVGVAPDDAAEEGEVELVPPPPNIPRSDKKNVQQFQANVLVVFVEAAGPSRCDHKPPGSTVAGRLPRETNAREKKINREKERERERERVSDWASGVPYSPPLAVHDRHDCYHVACVPLLPLKRGEYGAAPEYVGRGNGEITEKTRRSAISFATIPACENPGATPPGIEPGSSWWEVSSLTTAPPRPRGSPVKYCE